MTQENYPIHPAAELFPMMSEAEYEGLREDIRLHGQNDDVLIWDGKLLDGRNRLRACLELGIEPGWAEVPKTLDPVAWVLSHNLHRRHLTTAQRAMVAEKLATLLHGDNQHKKEDSGIPLSSKTQENAAKTLHVSTDSVKKARKVRAKATKKVIAAVEAGTMSLNAAVATTKPSAEKEKARAEARAAKEKAKADAKAEREKAKDERDKAKADAAAAKEKAKADAKAAKEAAAGPAGQAKNIKNLIHQHIDKAARLVCDLNRVSPNEPKRSVIVKMLQEAGMKLW